MQHKKILWIILALGLVLALFSFLNRGRVNQEAETIRILRDGQPVGEITLEEVRALPVLEKQLTLHSSQGNETHLFTGTLLRDVLASIDPSMLTHGQQVISTGIDGYTVAFDKKEVIDGDKVLLIYAEDGKPLGSKADGGTGPFRIIVTADQFAMRADKFITQLEVR